MDTDSHVVTDGTAVNNETTNDHFDDNTWGSDSGLGYDGSDSESNSDTTAKNDLGFPETAANNTNNDVQDNAVGNNDVQDNAVGNVIEQAEELLNENYQANQINDELPVPDPEVAPNNDNPGNPNPEGAHGAAPVENIIEQADNHNDEELMNLNHQVNQNNDNPIHEGSPDLEQEDEAAPVANNRYARVRAMLLPMPPIYPDRSRARKGSERYTEDPRFRDHNLAPQPKRCRKNCRCRTAGCKCAGLPY